MYENIGKKIKGLVKAMFAIEAIVAVIAGLIVMSIDEDMVLIGLLVMIGGTLVAWVSSWLLYGFGELIDKVCDIERNTRGGLQNIDAQPKVDLERIGKLEKLRAQGLITEEEYQQAIAKEQ